MGFKLSRRHSTSSHSQTTRRSSIFRRLSCHSRDEGSLQSENTVTVDPQADNSTSEQRRSREIEEIGRALRAIGDDLNDSTSTLHSTT